MIILDSDVIIEILNKNSRIKDQLITKIEKDGDQVATTAINFQEILYGILKRKNIAELNKSHLIYSFDVIPFTKRDAEIAARVEFSLEKSGKKKPKGDILIASIAIRTGSKLFTLNKKHFQDIPELKLFI
ncbi:MAG: type II toxin-antitoxin system VapC family toxin [Candidatus Helarchaeota archaeon]